jgi:signal transduction histidine kinase
MSELSPYLRYQELQSYVGWTDDDVQRVQSIFPLIRPHIDALIDDFYAEVERHPEARQVITGGAEQINRLKKSLKRWLAELFSGRYDRDYVERRWRVGYRHVEIGLNQVYTNAALSRLRHGILVLIEKDWQGSASDLLATRASLNTLIDLDLTIIEDAYQTEYRRRQSAAERLATIGKIAGGVAHELRNPLNVIKTSAYYLSNTKAPPPPEKIKSHLQRIERQIGVADRVITALNDIARLPVPEMKPIHVESFLREIIELNRPPANVQLQLDVTPESLTTLGDRAQLLIVFGNLVRNAFDAMPEGGSLRIAAKLADNQAEISVNDTGSGISADALPHILEPLYSTKAKGMGLGLSISHDIISRHQGKLVVESQLGAGSTFTVRLLAVL